MLQGSLFTQDFLEEGIVETDEWRALDAKAVEKLAVALRRVFADFPVSGSVNEAHTEQDLIHPVLKALGWEHMLPQQRASLKGRSDVPDVLLFADAGAKAKANAEAEPANRFRHGTAVCEDKAWQIPLDRAEKSKGKQEVPSTQILRYLTQAEIHSDRRILWGILTNGRHWRLYHQQARSRSEEFLELDLPAILGLPGFENLFVATPERREHWLRVFCLMFRREAFVPATADGRTFHRIALDEGRHWEERVAKDLSALVFDKVFPALIEGLVANDPEAPKPLTRGYLAEVKDAALILLYRLLFVLYAEDRNLLPVRDGRYDEYGMRLKVRDDIARRMDDKDVFAESLGDYYSRVQRLFRAIAKGERSLGLPPYNGGLFDGSHAPILGRVELPDAVFAPAVDALSRHDDGTRKRWINYRDLSVQQLGSIYERLLEHEPVPDGEKVVIRPNVFARKGSGSYYTPEELVALIIHRTVGPLVEERRQAFKAKAEALASDRRPKVKRLKELTALDPATAILSLRICDPAMGSGHFLVSLVDYLADCVLEAVAEAEDSVSWTDYYSPLAKRIADLRGHIESQAKTNKWTVERGHLDDRLIVRRIILKRVIHGVDLNPMAVELAKVSLWLHTFTVGAPLSFLDHHLRCGNSLFGEQVRPVMDEISGRFKLTINRHVTSARNAAKGMQQIEDLSDIDIGEVKASAAAFASVVDDTRPLETLLNLRQALRWLGADDLAKKSLHPALVALFDGTLGDLLTLATGRMTLADDGQQPDLTVGKKAKATKISHAEVMTTAARILGRAREIIRDQRFLHWQVAFPDVWDNWESAKPTGGFDAVIGNPPWDRIKLQEVEWFAARRPGIALAQTAAERKRLIERLYKTEDPLTGDYEHAQRMAEAGARVARAQGNYPLLSGGDTNIYSLFVEQALRLVKPEGLAGLVTPSGIASDLGASEFFRSVATTGRLACLFDFENKGVFFPDVDSRFKFCTFVVGGEKRSFPKADCAFYLHAVEEIEAPGRAFTLKADDFRKVNPNTGTAPVFRTARDAELTTEIYSRVPVLVDHSGEWPVRIWPVQYSTMFHMTNDSGLFRTAAQLQSDGYYRIAGNRWKKAEAEFVPLYEGKMVQAFDHRAANIVVNLGNVHRPAQPEPATEAQHADPAWLPNPQFWVAENKVPWPVGTYCDGPLRVNWAIGFKDVTAPTNVRTMIAAAIPFSGAGNTLPLIVPNYLPPLKEGEVWDPIEEYHTLCGNVESAFRDDGPLWLANLNAFVFDFVARQKVQGQHLNWYIVEQLPVMPWEAYIGKEVGTRSMRDLVREEVLRLTYTAHDMEPFARDMGYKGKPFPWDEDERRHSRARLDAIYFMLYGLDRDAASYVLDTFPIVREQDIAAHGRYLTKDLILGYMAAFAAGDPDTRIHVK